MHLFEAAGVPASKLVMGMEGYGNTSAASIPLALNDACLDGTLIAGHKVLLSAFGAGLTWGSAVMRWPEVVPG